MESYRFLKTAHQPQNKVTHVCLSGADTEIIMSLEALGITCLPVTPCAGLAFPLNTHADISLHHLGGDAFLCTHLHAALPAHWNQRLTRGRAGEAYPKDCLLNGVPLPPYYIGNFNVLDKLLLSWIEINGLIPIFVKQGYTKCNVCVVDSHSIITSDAGIARALQPHAVDVLLIRGGSILLNNYQSGFIGGTGGLLAPDKLAFCGNLDLHPDGGAIRRFAAKRGVECISLSDVPLRDIGSILPVCEQTL